jgi:CrcB protein
MYNVMVVFIGGGAGSIVRYGISELIRNNFRSSFPLATLISNVLSCLVLALAVGMLADKMTANPAWRTFIVVGFCGGFSTFSTFSYESIELIKSGNTAIALANVALSIVICFSIVYFLARTN